MDNRDALERIRVAMPRFRPEAGVPAVAPQQAAAQETLDVKTERRMLESVLGPAKAPAPLRTLAVSAHHNGQGTAPPTAAPSLVASMAQRLSQLESAQAALRLDMVAKDRELLAARRQLQTALHDAASSREALEGACGDAEASSRAARREQELVLARDALASQNARLREENDRLVSRVGAMESFLSDYGLVWVGGEGEGEEGEGQEDEGEEHRRVKEVDVQLVKLRLMQLNKLAGEGKTVVVEKNGAHVFEQAKGLPLALYADGILIGRGPFRPFGAPHTDAFIADVCDGYFPFEFKDSHPGGVVFELSDKTGERFVPGPSTTGGGAHPAPGGAGAAEGKAGAAAPGFVAFSGEGRSLGSVGRGVTESGGGAHPHAGGRPPSGRRAGGHPPPATGRPASRMDSRVANFATLGDSHSDVCAPLSADRLLSSLPSTTIAGGSVVDVRGVVASALGLSAQGQRGAPSRSASPAPGGDKLASPGVLLADTPVIRALRARATDAALQGEGEGGGGGAPPDDAPFDMAQVATIQVKLDVPALGCGARVLLVKLLSDDTVGELRAHVDAARPGGAPAYELRSAAPPRAFLDMQQTLRQAGLMPNATLIVRCL